MAKKAKIPAEEGKKVTITISSKSEAEQASPDVEAYQEPSSESFTIVSGDKILTITIAE